MTRREDLSEGEFEERLKGRTIMGVTYHPANVELELDDKSVAQVWYGDRDYGPQFSIKDRA